ncbi:MAG: hypothetical protein V4488_23105 [Pseudomonadota bacterium]
MFTMEACLFGLREFGPAAVGIDVLGFARKLLRIKLGIIFYCHIVFLIYALASLLQRLIFDTDETRGRITDAGRTPG